MSYYLGGKRGNFKKIFFFVKTYFRTRDFLNKKRGAEAPPESTPLLFHAGNGAGGGKAFKARQGDGLAADTIANCDYTVKIPMYHGVDSLNVAAASAVAFWELRPR